MRRITVCVCALALATAALAEPRERKRAAGDEAFAETKDVLSAETFSGLKLRAIGPAVTSGRVGDLAVDPNRRSRYFVAVASGGVWKTENAGTTWTPVFDKEGSYSIGCVTLDPSNPNVVWVGTGENNSQRSVGYGDGVYRSRDGGASWENLGLKTSEHIAKIVIDPRDSNVVYVAAQGPLWASGGERGLYKTADGGRSWKQVLAISEHTGVTDLLMDPRNPDVLIAAAYQRRRHVWTLIDGGPESAIYKSTDAGASWRKIGKGLPDVDLGRIGLAQAPARPDVVYALVEAAGGKGGLFRSTNGGESWEKRSSYQCSSPQYYSELVPDPVNPERLYSMDVFLQVSDDGGKTFRRAGERFKHVDNHALWIDPADTDYLLVGCDGGLYESFDRGATWSFKENLPVTQFYRVAVDEAAPFYNVYGGTQDNFTLGGPARTRSIHGITNADWFVTQGGDGFWAAVDPTDPNIVYSEAQHGALVRFDRASGEKTGIQPQVGAGEEPLRWNWDSPLIISPHAHTRLYFAANRLFRSDDRGDSWRPVSPDLTRRIDRDTLPVMGRVWGPDAVAKNASTSHYGNIVSLAESPLREGLLFAGTDDGLIQVSEDGGADWRRIERFGEVPDRSYVRRLTASQHDAGVVYAAFDNHKMGDFRPYLLKSSDAGRSWASIAGNLPARGSVYALVEDHVDPKLLFAGTELGLFFSRDGGGHWVQLKGGMPTIAVRDLAIQKRENDLVVATFGRGFFILDDYSPLRSVSREALGQPAVTFPVRDALLYVPTRQYELRGKSFLGETFFTAPNPPYGAVLTYVLKDGLKSAKERRQEAEKKALEAKQPLRYPTNDELRAEAEEREPAVIITVADETGAVVRRLAGPREKGFHRVAWDLRYPTAVPVEKESEGDEDDNIFGEPDTGPLARPGRYSFQIATRVAGVETKVGEPQAFDVVPLAVASLPAADRAALLAFQHEAARLQRAVLGARRAAEDAKAKLGLIRRALLAAPGASDELRDRADAIEDGLGQVLIALRGDRALRARNVNLPPSILERAQSIIEDGWLSSSAPTQTQRDAWAIANRAFTTQLAALRRLVEVDLAGLEQAMEEAGAPWTPGRLPRWPDR